MKKTIITYLFFVLTLKLIAQQNLVPNPSFENMVTCPNAGFTDISSTANWYNPTGYSPDYYNACATDTNYGCSVPKNGFGYQTARTGVAYAGIILHIATDGREYIQVQLTDSLRLGKHYSVSFFVALADSCNYSTNNVGLLLSTSPVSSASLLYLPYTPQIQNNNLTNPLTTPNTWIQISDTIIASGGERFITIGNFNNDVSTDTTHLNNGTNWTSFSYYYIDDVSIILLDTATGFGFYERNDVDINIFPNPTNDYLTIKSTEQIKTVDLINVFGQSLGSFTLTQSEETINFSKYPSGEYYIRIRTKSGKHKIKKIVINSKPQ